MDIADAKEQRDRAKRRMAISAFLSDYVFFALGFGILGTAKTFSPPYDFADVLSLGMALTLISMCLIGFVAACMYASVPIMVSTAAFFMPMVTIRVARLFAFVFPLLSFTSGIFFQQLFGRP